MSPEAKAILLNAVKNVH